MYEAFFNLKKKPFELVPNPEFLYLSRTHKRAITFLEYGIRERVGFVLLTGDVGCGKTTIVRDMLKRINSKVKIANITNTKATSEQLLAMITSEFGIEAQQRDKVSLMTELNDFLIDQFALGRNAILLIDEAQNLDTDMLEEVRLLSNLETDDMKLLQIILVGQPELRDTLARPEMRQLRQRIGIGCHITPLSVQEVADYILHRLEIAGNRDAMVFPESVVHLIHSFSRGIPRLINILCDYLMLSAFIDEIRELTPEITKEIIDELDLANKYWDDSDFSGHSPEALEVEVPDEYAASREDTSLPVYAGNGEQNDLRMKLIEVEERTNEMAEVILQKLEAISAEVKLLKAQGNGNGSEGSTVSTGKDGSVFFSEKSHLASGQSHLDILRLIQKSSDNFFSFLKNDEILNLLGSAEQIVLEQGDVLDIDANSCGSVYIVKEGAMKILSPSDTTSLRIGILHRGGVYGLENLLLNSSVHSRAIALKRSTLYKLSSDVVNEVIARHPEYYERRSAIISGLEHNMQGGNDHVGG